MKKAIATVLLFALCLCLYACEDSAELDTSLQGRWTNDEQMFLDMKFIDGKFYIDGSGYTQGGYGTDDEGFVWMDDYTIDAENQMIVLKKTNYTYTYDIENGEIVTLYDGYNPADGVFHKNK